MDPQEERLVRNEALFRQVNERLRELGESFSVAAEHAEFVCECSHVGCAERIEMTIHEYEGVRDRAGHFLVRPGHENPELELVVEKGRSWVVTRKADADLAGADVDPDPRS